MRKSIYLMAIAVAAVALAACEKEPAFLADVTYPEEVTGNTILVDAKANDFLLEIKTEGAWKIECDSFFFTVEPEEGTGDATVNVSVQNNKRSKRKTGHLTIVFPDHEDKNKTLTIEQKWQGEYGENADVLDKTNSIYAVGFGFDTTKGLYPNTDCLRAEIFNTSQLIKEGIEGTAELKMTATLSTVTGNSISELSNKLTVKANAEGGVGKFKAEANASFTMDYTDNSTHEYAINYLEATLTTAKFTKGIGRLKTRKYMTEEAYEDINGLFEDYAQTRPDGTPNEDWAINLIRDYGTHVVISARLGGRVRQSLDVDISDINESYDLHAFAKASYEGVFASAGGSVSDDFHKSFEKHSNSMKVQVQALGGDSKLAKALVAKDGFTEANYLAWLYSVDNDNMALMGFVDESSLVPLYELVDKNATLERDGFDGRKRYDALYDFMTNGKAAEIFEDNSTYDTGTVTAFAVPTFGTAYNNTLVKDIMLGGQLVGQVCEEYIPAINRNNRVIVVYPVIGTSVRYNMGFFIGDDTHKPARVAWNGANTNIVEYPELDFGKVDKLYLRGSSITTTPAEGVDVLQGSLEDEYLAGVCYVPLETGTGAGGKDKSYNYPIVKIFDKIWTRENYNQSYTATTLGAVTTSMDGKGIRIWSNYHTQSSAADGNAFPKGWRVAKSADYNNMIGKLGANGFSEPALALLNKGVTGFELYFVGYYNTSDWYLVTSKDEAWLGTSDKKYISFRNTGAVSSGTFSPNKYCIRLVKQ
jgi:hypothetical protein